MTVLDLKLASSDNTENFQESDIYTFKSALEKKI